MKATYPHVVKQIVRAVFLVLFVFGVCIRRDAAQQTIAQNVDTFNFGTVNIPNGGNYTADVQTEISSDSSGDIDTFAETDVDPAISVYLYSMTLNFSVFVNGITVLSESQPGLTSAQIIFGFG
jgi:hypothetical protein